MRFSITTLTMLLASATASPSTRNAQRSEIDLHEIPLLNIAAALVDKLPADADVKVLPGGLSDLTSLDVKGIISCVVDALPVDVSLSILPVPTSTRVAVTSTITHTNIVCITDSPTPTPAVAQRSEIDLSQVPIVNLITGLIDKLPIDTSVKVLPGGLSDLSDLDLHSLLSCVVDKLPVDVNVSALDG